MRVEEDFGSRIRTALQKECSNISASEGLKSRIDEEICKKQEENSMKHLSVKKMCIGVAAACLLVSGITVFAGGASYFVSSSGIDPEYTDYQDISKAEKELGYAVDSVERFVNGYVFDGVSVESIDAYTEETGKIYSIPTLDVRYRKDGNLIELSANRKIENGMDGTEEKQPDAVRTCGDIILRYDEYTDKIVPDSYELTEEDKTNEQRDDYNIIYRSVSVTQEEADGTKSEQIITDGENAETTEADEVKQGSYVISEDGTVTANTHGTQDNEQYVILGAFDICIRQRIVVSWEKDGIAYQLTGNDLGMSAEEMLDMAEEILRAE